MLDKDFNFDKTYYKVLNKEENHNGFQYEDGVNHLDKDFDDSNTSCSKGGLYFTSLENVPEFCVFGNHIREIKISNDSKVVKDQKKWRTDKLVLGRRITMDEYFDTLWDPDKFDWEYSFFLVEHCSDQFDKWWDSEKYNWDYSRYLSKYSSEDFDKWWDPDKYNWVHSHFLAEYCSNHLDKWWDHDKFNWKHFHYLTEYSLDQFDTWWNPEKFNWNDSYYLARYCSQYFNKWWDADKFDWAYHSDSLPKYCSEYKHIWGPELEKRKGNYND